MRTESGNWSIGDSDGWELVYKRAELEWAGGPGRAGLAPKQAMVLVTGVQGSGFRTRCQLLLCRGGLDRQLSLCSHSGSSVP